MSITAETAKAHANDFAVLCCRAEAGITIEPANLEDPAIFDELVDSGLLNLDGCLKIGQILGAKLTKTSDSLSPLTPDNVEGYKETVETEEKPEEAEEAKEAPATPAVAATTTVAGGVLKIHIGEGKDIDLSIPVGALGGGAAEVVEVEAPKAAAAAAVGEPKKIRDLTRNHYAITEVVRGPETKIEGTVLTIREGIEQEVIDADDLIKDFHIEIITPANYHTYSETIMDVQPIATKDGDSKLGKGITRVIDGAVMVLTGTDEGGVQIGEFGSSEGYLDENIMWGRPGCPEKGEILIKGNIVVQAKTNMERRGPMTAHTVFDIVTQEIREALKKVDDEYIVDTEVFEQIRHPGQKKVVIVKEIMGQGAMHDNFILPVEPVGVLGSRANVDLGNLPVCMSPLEVLDGCIHAITCIGPASKEMSRHYWREPLVLAALNDPELDLCGVIFVGSPQINAEKFYVSERLGQTVEMMDVDGAFITTEGFGNNHIDFASHHEQIGMRGVPVVGLSFCANQGALVVGNKYMVSMVDNNKSEGGIENEVLANNTLCPEEAIRAIAMLKARMAGEEIKPAEKKWNPNVKANNVEAINEATGTKMKLVDNEQNLPLSQKRIDKGYN